MVIAFVRVAVMILANRYTKLENLAWSQTVFLQFTFCRKRRFMKPLLLSSVAIFIHNTGCLFLTDMIENLNKII